MIPWDDPALRYEGDSARQAKYRLLQSWYRETELGLPPGLGPGGTPNGAWLPEEAVAATPELNFLRSPELWAVAQSRLDERTGAFEPDRLTRSLLSSQPLCVNLFGMLGLHREAAAKVLGDVLGLPIATVDALTIETAPVEAKKLLGDRTAFDAYAEITLTSGETGFLAIETKYTEPFSKDRFGADRRKAYLGLAGTTAGVVAPPDESIFDRSTSQQFRNTLLALLHRASGDFDIAIPVVAACRDDAVADASVRGVNAFLEPDCQIRRLSFEAVVERASGVEVLAEWASHFSKRYLDTSPVA